MSDQQSPFVYTRLEWKLQERLADALKYINSIAKEDVLGCDAGGLKEIVRLFAVAPPILRSDLMVADERIGESVDLISEPSTLD